MNYFIELAIIHSILVAAYCLLLRQERQYGKMRLYLLGTTALALIIPALRLPAFWQLFETNPLPTATQTYTMAPAVIAAQSNSSLDLASLALYTYWIVTVLLLMRIGYSILRLFLLKSQSSAERVNNLTVRKAHGVKGSFTFFQWIFIDPNISEKDESYQLILQHEQAHARLGHTYDILLLEVFRAVCWWLPGAWFARNEMKKIHEYQADAYALKSCPLDQYSNVLISATLKAHGMSMASSFHDGLILKRLKAMKLQMKTIKPWKLGTLAVLSTLLSIAFACNEELDAELKDMGSKSNMISFDQLPADMQKDVAALRDDLVFVEVTVETTDDKALDSKLSEVAALQDIDPESIHSMRVDKSSANAGQIYLALVKDGKNLDYIAQKSKSDEEVFTVVEEQPEFPGGMTAYYEFLSEQMTYPTAAKEKGITGRVYVQFIVMPDGSLSDVKVVKGVDPLLDEEAIRVVKASPNFIPGKQRGKAVKVRMVLPIIFALGDGAVANQEDTPQPEKPNMKVDAEHTDGKWIGTVYGEDNQPLAGVNIIEQGTTNGTVSDRDGSFSLEVSKGASHLVLSHVSYHTARVVAK
ncbi:M56 family metallopeptidase [Marinoscillum furvescens]|uniref:Outer membrane transport energization protein TonB n=1 Tax=Marinoscillum furvescens DSM 4134 TaxID=1122208 RepID=A0A3D9L062_MARFU|nr:M56 family metallopeptidase [Marinoscillum furvescens]RED93172.1 outer membrane transport energization protein TonB [Marinoscillum furvescens DSM 4134]